MKYTTHRERCQKLPTDCCIETFYTFISDQALSMHLCKHSAETISTTIVLDRTQT